MPPAESSAAWQQAASAPSLLQQLSELTSQQVHNIHASHTVRGSTCTATSCSELLWQQADDAAIRKRAALRQNHPIPHISSTPAASLLSPDALCSASYTYSQLCHDLPLLTVDGVDALASGLLAHISAGTPPAAPFHLTLPFLYQLTQQTDRLASSAASASINEALVASLSHLSAVVLFSLFPFLLTSSQSSLSAFLAPLPPSLPSLLAAEQRREEAERAAVPAFVVDSTDVEDEQEEKVKEWSDREDDNGDIYDDDDDEFTADDDEEEEEAPVDAAADGQTSAVSSWAELEEKLCSLIHLWHPRSLSVPLQPSSATDAQQQLVWQKVQLPSLLLRIHSLASQHQHMFAASSTTSALLHHRLSTILLSLLLSSPTLIPSYMPTVLSLLPTCSLSLDAFTTAGAFDGQREEEERVCLLLLSHLCGNDKVRATTDGRLYVWRLLDGNLAWLASYLQHIHTSLSASSAVTSSPSSVSIHLSLLASLLVILDFYLCCHPGLKAGRVDVGESLQSAGIVDELLSLISLSSSQPLLSSSTAAGDCFPLPALYTFLTTGSAISPLIALQCERSTVLLQHVALSSGVAHWQAEKLLLPLLLSWQLLHSQRDNTVRTYTAKQPAAVSTVSNDKPPASKVGKKKTKLLVSAIVETDPLAEDGAELLPAVDAVTAPPPAVVEALVPLVARTTAAVRHCSDTLLSASEVVSLTPLIDTLSFLAHLIRLSPSLSAIVRPFLPSASSGQLKRQLSDWTAAMTDLRRQTGEAIRGNSSASANETMAAVDDEDDEQRRQRVRSEQRARHAKRQYTAELQRLMSCCKMLFTDTAGNKRD